MDPEWRCISHWTWRYSSPLCQFTRGYLHLNARHFLNTKADFRGQRRGEVSFRTWVVADFFGTRFRILEPVAVDPIKHPCYLPFFVLWRSAGFCKEKNVERTRFQVPEKTSDFSEVEQHISGGNTNCCIRWRHFKAKQQDSFLFKDTLPKTNSSHLKNGGWFLYLWDNLGLFSKHFPVTFRQDISAPKIWNPTDIYPRNILHRYPKPMVFYINVSPFKFGGVEVPLYMVQPIFPPCLAVEALMEFAKGEVKKRHIHTGVSCEGFLVIGKGCQEGLIIRSGFFMECRSQMLVPTYLLHIYHISYTSSKTNMSNPKPWSFGSDDSPFKQVKISGLSAPWVFWAFSFLFSLRRAAGNPTKIRLFWSNLYRFYTTKPYPLFQANLGW